MESKFKSIPCVIKKLADRPDIVRFIGTTESMDRGGDIIEVEGWQFDNFMKNPVILWSHSHSTPPIAKAISIERDLVNKRVIFDVEFADEKIYPFAGVIKKLVQGGFINAVSVGAIPLEHKTIPEEELPEHLKDSWMPAWRISKAELVELSIVSVPMNQEALQVLDSAERTELAVKSLSLAYEFAKTTDIQHVSVAEDGLVTVTKNGAPKPKATLKESVEFEKSLKEFSSMITQAFEKNSKSIDQLNETVKQLAHLTELASVDLPRSADKAVDPAEDYLDQVKKTLGDLRLSLKA